MNFVKMHGLGNDFVLIDSRKNKLDGLDLKQLALRLCDRHFGVGADGLLIVWPSPKAHYRMQVINADGSEAEMCGNGIRCFAKYVYETDQLKEEVISVETLAGTILPAVILENGKVLAIEVDMGEPKNEGQVKLAGYTFQKISMGNPHAAAFVDNLNELALAELGPAVETDRHFKNRTNVEFVQVLNERELAISVWERGVGETLACGTGACAAVVAAHLAGKTGRRVLAHLPGGNLEIEWTEENRLLMRGPAETVFAGECQL
ncbi:MAG: diaminopimelate epimerase [Candidatus Saganbacteria bacterium]|nr:diaminopimelate epimerase [Candidatus Saganbacteria bacterium]